MQIKSIVTAVSVVMSMTAGVGVQAEAYPTRTVRIVVPYGTGGGSDILARQIGTRIQRLWGQGVVVDNKAGASGNIGSLEVVRAPPDGYTLLLQNSTMVTNLGVMGKLPYDPEKDLTPIMLLGTTPIALAAHASLNVHDIKELLAASKAKPDTLSYGSCGIGTPQHFVMELVKQRTGLAATHAGYKGCAPAVTDLIGGQVPLAIVSANLLAPYAKSGRLNVLGVSSGLRYGLLPDIATIEEQGFRPFDFSIWYGLMGPKNMPPYIVNRIVADISKIFENPEVISNLSKAGVEIIKGTGPDLTRLIRSDTKRYTELARSAKIKAE